MKSSILYFLLLIFGILFNLSLNAGHKQDRFPKTLSEKSLKYILSRGGSIVAFDLNLVLLLVEIDFVIEEQSRKGNVFRIYGTSHIKMILALLTEVIALYI